MACETVGAELEASNQAFAQIKEYGISLRDGKTNTIWFLNLLLSFVNSILREYQYLKIGYEKNIRLEAWACRNLLELDIYAKYVVISEANTKRFIGDRLIDGIDIFESMKAWMAYMDASVKTPELDETIRIAYEQKTFEGVTATKHLRVQELAAVVGMAADYRHMNKLCSKLVHTTAWSVLAMNHEGEFGAFRPMLFHTGVRYGLGGFHAIREHVEKLGIEPPA